MLLWSVECCYGVLNVAMESCARKTNSELLLLLISKCHLNNFRMIHLKIPTKLANLFIR